MTETNDKSLKDLSASIHEKLREFDAGYGDFDAKARFDLAEEVATFGSAPGGSSPIVPVPKHLLDLVNATNQIVSFILDDTTHFGTGILVGPGYVLTASHLFFERTTRKLTDSTRLPRITAEVQTTRIGSTLMPGETISSPLYQPDTNDWLIDPPIKDGVAQRELFNLDFAIVKLKESLGDDMVGKLKRGWFKIPTADAAEVLTAGLGFRILQFLDRGPLLTSAGFVHKVNPNGMRVLHTASTAQSASGAPLLSDEGNLLGIHVSGCPSNELPKFNRAIPIRRIAEIIDEPDANGDTIRDRLQS
ncbi:MAG: trypsin-like peptidase domain-containing protein [Acidobacteria bacterium]|nr:trypsin-like peptidase domain-containing protein [Acidobacteriota bacterium]MBV9069400.1 trypsin-like peptidase domain-containing protein [Acidobacteriota bacterium]MBV9185693.1 trypsin-like peptidase domain-containing protein [Acidobacteriota bacterium]